MNLKRMIRQDTPFNRKASTILAVILLATAAMVWAQADGDKTGQSIPTSPIGQNAAPKVEQPVGPDSVYVEVNRGFLALEPIFHKGCFDCHSNKTEFPWYYKLPIVKGMIDKDIKQGRKHIDMSRGFPFATNVNVADDLVAIQDELKSGDMPPIMYRMMHWSAKPSDAEKDSIYAWIDRSLRALAAKGIEPTGPGSEEGD